MVGNDELAFIEDVHTALGPVSGFSLPGYPVGSDLSPPREDDDLERGDVQ